MFGRGSPYVHILWSLLAGALLPVIIWFIGKRFKISYTRLPNLPVMLSGASYIPPATGINYSSWFLVAFVFRTCFSASQLQEANQPDQNTYCGVYDTDGGRSSPSSPQLRWIAAPLSA